MKPYYENDGVTLYLGDCIEVMRSLPDNSVHAVVTDPPYGIGFMGKDWDQPGAFGSSVKRHTRARSIKAGPTGIDSHKTTQRGAAMEAGRYDLSSSGLQSFQLWCEAWAAECLRVLKPGGHLVSFGGSRTWHRLAVGVEDAGFEIRDSIAWLYGSGFPKSHNLDDEWEGWGTALKPAFEPIVVGRKPFPGTVASNVAEHGTGALHVDATRIATMDILTGSGSPPLKHGGMNSRPFHATAENRGVTQNDAGRWPTNVVLDESQAAELDKQTGILTSGANPTKRSSDKSRNAYGDFKGQTDIDPARGADSGGASRFFPTFHYDAKAPGSERPEVDGIQHPTVKPLDLMRWLVRLVTPPNGTVLEPFAGSGTTLEAALIEGFSVIGIEREADYLPLIVQRITKPLQQSLFGEGLLA